MNKKAVADRLKELRKRSSYSQEGMARIALVDQTTFSNWERGAIPKQWGSLIALSKAFGVSTDYLLGLTDDPTPAHKPELPEDLREFWTYWRTLTGFRRLELLDVARAFHAAEHGMDRATVEHLYLDVLMELLLDYIEDLGGEKALDEILDVLESALPEARHNTPRLRTPSSKQTHQ